MQTSQKSITINNNKHHFFKYGAFAICHQAKCLKNLDFKTQKQFKQMCNTYLSQQQVPNEKNYRYMTDFKDGKTLPN